MKPESFPNLTTIKEDIFYFDTRKGKIRSLSLNGTTTKVHPFPTKKNNRNRIKNYKRWSNRKHTQKNRVKLRTTSFFDIGE